MRHALHHRPSTSFRFIGFAHTHPRVAMLKYCYRLYRQKCTPAAWSRCSDHTASGGYTVVAGRPAGASNRRVRALQARLRVSSAAPKFNPLPASTRDGRRSRGGILGCPHQAPPYSPRARHQLYRAWRPPPATFVRQPPSASYRLLACLLVCVKHSRVPPRHCVGLCPLANCANSLESKIRHRQGGWSWWRQRWSWWRQRWSWWRQRWSWWRPRRRKRRRRRRWQRRKGMQHLTVILALCRRLKRKRPPPLLCTRTTATIRRRP